MSVVAGLTFSTQTGRFRGSTLRSEEALSSLVDVFDDLSKFDNCNGGLTEKVLQFLWRDDSSSMQIIGPFFEFSKSDVSTSELHIITRDVVRAFHCFGLKTRIISCDGSPVNRAWMQQVLQENGVTLLQMIAPTTGLTEHQSVLPVKKHVEALLDARATLAQTLKSLGKSEPQHAFACHGSRVSPNHTEDSMSCSNRWSFLKPLLRDRFYSQHFVATRHWFSLNEWLFIVVDPTHQLKSMRNQLHGEPYITEDSLQP
jgi:hypothetical protein